MAKRLKTLNLCDASVERLKRSPRGQSSFARECILSYDRNRAAKWDLQRELDQQNAFLAMNRENYNTLVSVLLAAYDYGWTVQGMLAELMDKEQLELTELRNNGNLRTHIRMAVAHRAMHGAD